MPSAIAASADFIVQAATTGGDSSTGPMESWDAQRTSAFGIFGFLYSGFFQRLLYKRYDTLFGVGSGLALVTKKVVVEGFVHAPLIYLPIFYMSTGLLQSMSTEEALARMQASYQQALTTYYVMWMPINYVLFSGFIPESRRILLVAGLS